MKITKNCLEQKAIEMLVQNKPQAVIANELGVCQKTISNVKSRNPEAIEKAAQKYLDAIPSIIEDDLKEIKLAQDLTNDLIHSLKEESQIIETKEGKAVELFPSQRIAAIQRYKEYVDKKITDIKRSIGILPAQTQGLIFQQFNLIKTENKLISNKIIQLLGSSISTPEDDMPLEAELVDNPTS